MPNTYFQFQQFRIDQEKSGMKVTTDACLFGAWVADQIKRASEPGKVLDIGTGTGLLALMLAQVTKESQIDVVEINDQAFKEANSNFKHTNWRGRLNIFHQPIQDFFTTTKYDLIICNPPFFQNSMEGQVQHKNQALHSTSLSMKELVQRVTKLLSSKGRFYVLYPEKEMVDFIALLKKSGLHLLHSVKVRNEARKPIFRRMCAFSFDSSSALTHELIIRRDDGKYTEDFWELLKDYYLEYNNPSKQ